MITPTVGRVVWFHQGTSGIFPGSEGACAAIVAHVWGDRMINLCVIDANGNTHARTSVPLVHDGDEKPASGFCCEWMPYQKQKAAAGDHNSESAEPRPK